MDKLWPEVPPDLKYTEFRLPGTFRELAASQNLTHEEIGRIVRCLALNTDFFMTPRIEPEVHFYGKRQRAKDKARKRAESTRKMGAEEPEIVFTDTKNSVTEVKEVEREGNSKDASSPTEKTPSILKEELPPIVPLEKKAPSSLEKPRRGRPRKNAAADRLQQDLFSLAESTCSSASTGNSQGAPQNLSGDAGTANRTQDIESDSRAVFDGNATMPTGNDSRADAAWIPQKFAAFWEKYPKKVAKQAAMKAFVKIIKSQNNIDVFMKILFASLEWWKMQPNWKREAGKYIPHPATWLNRGSWEDSIDNNGKPAGQAEFLGRDSDSDDDLIRRMTGG